MSKKRDYPRGCGDTRWSSMLEHQRRGLSPRVRGHLQHVVAPRHRGGLSPRVRGHLIKRLGLANAPGTIPAGAGTPSLISTSAKWLRDYPRGCGDTRAMPGNRGRKSGLSPRVRGHPRRSCRTGRRRRTIPAGAGTPGRRSNRGIRAWDYPRGCGDTFGSVGPDAHEQGLSPRVRGHRAPLPDRVRPRRTIPAGAGTPRPRARR